MKRPKVPRSWASGGWRVPVFGLLAALAPIVASGCGDTTMPMPTGNADMAMAPDLKPPPAPPSQVWLTSGGGSATGNGQQLNVTIGGTPVVGSPTSGGQVFTFGYFVTDTL